MASMVLVSFSIASHLLTTTMTALPELRISPATLVSCSVTPVWASISSRATSQRSMAAMERSTL